jgi:CRISPR-associated protein Cmr6
MSSQHITKILLRDNTLGELLMTDSYHSWEKPKLKQPRNKISAGNTDGDGNIINNLSQPSPWLDHPDLPDKLSHNNASFVEYLRWMRVKSGDGTIDGGTILELFQEFKNNDVSKSLSRLTSRTKKLSHEWFEVTCPWRIRVGGTKGPESMLLPAFDALGMPYIPSSTLKGVARAIAMQDPNFTEEQIKHIFGDINPNSSMGLVIFLDAYPLPGEDKQGGLSPDMANSIWKWDRTTPPEYNTNPNVFISLKKSTFVIGLRQGNDCYEEIFNQVIVWLKRGLGYGIGSRVNTGYGSLDVKDEKPKRRLRILAVIFKLKGQLIHGGQKFTAWRPKDDGGWKPPGKALAEVRPTAFRSTMRYWFRALALGVLSNNQEIRDLELEIFGDIEPKPHTGLFRSEITNGRNQENTKKNENYSLAEGELILHHSSQTISLLENKKQALEQLLQNLTWLMFHLGGVGQGSRRPCYSRQNRSNPPWWRGASLTVISKDDFWKIPNNLNELKLIFRLRLQGFYTALQQFREKEEINYHHPRSILTPTPQTWAEVVDSNCRIVCVTGSTEKNKLFALAKLHEIEYQGRRYHRHLCGSTAKPSPVWIAEVGNFQVVTIFGVNEDSDNPRKQYLDKLQEQAGSNYSEIWNFI